jgi:hypothetical protein
MSSNSRVCSRTRQRIGVALRVLALCLWVTAFAVDRWAGESMTGAAASETYIHGLLRTDREVNGHRVSAGAGTVYWEIRLPSDERGRPVIATRGLGIALLGLTAISAFAVVTGVLRRRGRWWPQHAGAIAVAASAATAATAYLFGSTGMPAEFHRMAARVSAPLDASSFLDFSFWATVAAVPLVLAAWWIDVPSRDSEASSEGAVTD